MGNQKFIRLNDQGNDTRVNVSAITRYFESGTGGSFVYLADTRVEGNSPDIYATETPEQIDALLGVTGDSIRDAAPDLLAALEAVVRVADRKTAEFDMARAAIARARGVA